MQYRFEMKNMRDAGNFKKILCTMLLLCPLSAACAASKQTEAQLVENQNKITEVEHRISDLEQRVDGIDSSIHVANTRVYDVRNKAGKPTGMTAHPRVEPETGHLAATSLTPAGTQVSKMPPVKHVSPISGIQIASSPVVPVPVAATPTTPAVAATTTTAAVATPAKANTALKINSRAPNSMLDPASSLEGVDIKKAEPNSSHKLSLPPESAMYPPSKGIEANDLAPTANTNAQAAMPPVAMQQADQYPIATPITPSAPTKAMGGEKGAYKQALDLVLGGKYAEGRDKFNSFLQQYPNGSLAPNAHYWIGESFYAQKNYSDALLSFKQVTSGYPKHHKTPDALLKAGMTYDKLGDRENASLQYRALLADFPNSSAAKIARKKKF